jgi:hypothetical protein
VRVIQRGHGERFAREALASIGVGRCDVGEHFECDLALQSRIACPIDLAHPAGAKQRHDFVRTELSARAQRHGADCGSSTLQQRTKFDNGVRETADSACAWGMDCIA